jgi:uncharacterized membrane protein
MFLLRWIHFLAGITWIGLLYFFNFINIPLTGTMDGDTKKKVVPELMPRVLFFFRWGAMFTLLSGLGIILIKYFILGSGMTGPSGLVTTPGGWWITFGMLFGTVMWFNVWFIIWPAQQKIIPAVKAGEAPPAGLPARAGMASKINTYMSVPLLFFMGAASEGHYPIFNYYTLVIVTVVGFALVKFFYGFSKNIKGM